MTIEVETIQQTTALLKSLKENPRILDIGCGSKKRGNIGFDRYPFQAVDIVGNIENGLPFPDNSIDGIFIYHVLEHLSQHTFEKVMYEMWRCCKHNAWIRIKTPHYSGPDCWHDPTHIRPFALGTFKYYITTRERMHFSYQRRYNFKCENIRLNWHSFPEDEVKRPRSFLIRNIIEWLANCNAVAQNWCERLWCFWVGGFAEIDVTLRAIHES